jgi:hypothetical protein
MAAAEGMVVLPMDASFQPLFYTFEGLLDDINDRLQNPKKLFGTWGSKTGPAATECMKGLGHLKVALELRPALYGEKRMVAFQSHLAQRPVFEAAAQKLTEALNSIEINTPAMAGLSPSIQHYFARNVLAFLDAMQNFPACKRASAERVANFFSNNPAAIAKFRADLQSYLDTYDKKVGKAAAKYGNYLRSVGAAAAEATMNLPRPPLTMETYAAAKESAGTIGGIIDTATLKRYGQTAASIGRNTGLAATMPLPPSGDAGGRQGGGRRRRTHRHKRKSHRKSRRHH